MWIQTLSGLINLDNYEKIHIVRHPLGNGWEVKAIANQFGKKDHGLAIAETREAAEEYLDQITAKFQQIRQVLP